MTHSSFRLINGFCLFLIILFFSKGVFAFETSAKQAILVDFETGKVLYEKNSTERMGPSSMTKIMTAYMIFDALKKGEYDLDSKFLISKRAWKTGGSRMFLDVNDNVSLSDLIQGIIVQSGNDACVALAEGFSGSVETFSEEMNEKAGEMGMNDTNFVNPDGLPDDNHYSTAHDLSILARNIIRQFPEFYHYFSQKEFTYNKIRQQNRNTLLNNLALGVDGLKTGHTEAAGYGIVISAAKNDLRLVGVVNGLTSSGKRIEAAQQLLSYGFVNFKNIKVFEKGEVVEAAKVWGGKERNISAVLKDDLYILTNRRKNSRPEYKFIAKFKEPISAPIKKGQEIGVLDVFEADEKINSVKLYAEKDIDEANMLRKIIDKFKLFVSEKI
ncbi:MAG TPA: D-alanyl-D-alanine carboxypeptidase [Alphaproteobacteria bacterium]|nr:D-alanyl-D-alanine carboxypeptidase [Alphaproteobacteria bacterium]